MPQAQYIINEYESKYKKNMTLASKVTTLNSSKPSPYSIQPLIKEFNILRKSKINIKSEKNKSVHRLAKLKFDGITQKLLNEPPLFCQNRQKKINDQKNKNVQK